MVTIYIIQNQQQQYINIFFNIKIKTLTNNMVKANIWTICIKFSIFIKKVIKKVVNSFHFRAKVATKKVPQIVCVCNNNY